MHTRRTAGIALAATLSIATLSGCQALLAQQKTLPPDQLKSELVTPPAGSQPFSRGTLAPGGILTLDQYVDGMFSSTDRMSEKSDIIADGFKYAVQTNWRATDGTQADVFLVQFSQSGGAQDFVTSVSEGTSDEEKPAEPLASLSGIPEGESWSAGAVDSVGNVRQSAWFAVGNIAADMHFFTPGKANPAALTELAQAQYARLAGNVTAPSPLPSPTATAPAPADTAPAPTSPADQSRLQGDLMTPPDDSKPWPESTGNGPTGVLTLQQFVDRFASADNRQRATAEQVDRGFQYAVRENWNASDGSETDISLLQFATSTGAQSFTLAWQAGAGDAAGAGGTYPIPSSGDAVAYEHSKLTSKGNVWTESYAVVGNIALCVDFWVPAKADRATMTKLIQQQYAKVLADPTVAAAAKSAPALPSPNP